jgi:hypothetical protein
MMRSIFLSAILLVMGVGCVTETRTYTLAVRNGLNSPVSICLTKTYGPDEDVWISPEELVEPPHPATDQKPPGAVLLPGQTATRGPFTGEFDPYRGRAFLRVYLGTPNLVQMSAISKGSPDRLDVPLDVGMNQIEIKDGEGGRMTAVRVTGPWPTTQPTMP